MEEYVPRHASDEAVPELYYQQVASQGFDPALETGQRYRPYTGRHRDPLDDPDSTAYIIPITDTTDLEQPAAQPAPPQPFMGQVLRVEPRPQPYPERQGFWRRVASAWRRANTSFALYFNDPEKGFRRRATAALGATALMGAAAWLFSQGHNQEGYQPPVTAPPAPGPAESSRSFYDNLTPEHYAGQAYEWGAMADYSSPAEATPQLLGMIQDARAQGARVTTWGDTHSSNWGIRSVSVELPDNTYVAYYDTRHKLAILQYLSKMKFLEDDDDDEWDSS